MTDTFSTADVAPRDRATYWREVIMRGFAKHHFQPRVADDFRAKLSVDVLGDLVLSTIDCDPCDVARTRGDLALCDCDNYLLYLHLDGGGAMSQGDRHMVLEAEAFGLWDTRQPCALTLSRQTKCITVQIPRQILDARFGGVDRLVGRAMNPSRPLNGLVSGFLAMLPKRAADLDKAAEAQVAEQVLDLLALAFSAESESKVSGLYAPRQAALMRLKASIETRLSDPKLDPASAAAGAGISPRYANQLLAEIDTSVERYIVTRRLERCRRALESPAQGHRTVGDIAFSWGFSDLSHFGRRFKASFGHSPAAYRRQHT